MPGVAAQIEAQERQYHTVCYVRQGNGGWADHGRLAADSQQGEPLSESLGAMDGGVLVVSFDI